MGVPRTRGSIWVPFSARILKPLAAEQRALVARTVQNFAKPLCSHKDTTFSLNVLTST